MTDSRPLVSVIIPTYNRKSVLGRAIESVKDQSYNKIELIVVDDHSTDQTRQLVSSLQDVVYVRLDENMGVSKARNEGIKRANGKYISFLDSDDEWCRSKIEEQISHLESTQSSACICQTKVDTRSIIKDVYNNVAPSKKTRSKSEMVAQQLSFSQFFHIGSTFMAKKECVKNIGGFNEEMQRLEDVDFFIRYLQNYDVSTLEEVLVILHDTGAANPITEIKSIKSFRKANSDLIIERENAGDNVIPAQNLFLSQQYFHSGQYLHALHILAKSWPKNLTQLLYPLYGLYLNLFKQKISK